MALISSGIEKVMAFVLPIGIWEDGSSVAVPGAALVKWRSSWSDKFYQIYVNGRFAGATIDCGQRQMIVQMPVSLERPVRIEVFAVGAGQENTDFSNEIDSSVGHSGRVRISFLRGQNLPIGSTAQIYFNQGSGEIDYDNPLNSVPIRIWPSWQDKAGFGMSRFGVSDFGYDSSAAIGFGKGTFGYSWFGLDVEAIEWVSSPIAIKLNQEWINHCRVMPQLSLNLDDDPVIKIIQEDRGSSQRGGSYGTRGGGNFWLPSR